MNQVATVMQKHGARRFYSASIRGGARGGKIDCYVDCVSPYSYFAFLHLTRNREALRAYGVEVEFHPMFLGGIMQGSGNKPSWTLQARADYLKFDRARAVEYFGLHNVKSPDMFPISTLLPLRALHYIKANHPQSMYEAVLHSLWVALWENKKEVSKPPILREVLEENIDNTQEIEDILKAAQDPVWKQKLNDTTKEALDKGAYGAPWSWVRNAQGKEEPFFGSDRFVYMWRFLGIGFRDVEILPPKEKSKF